MSDEHNLKLKNKSFNDCVTQMVGTTHFRGYFTLNRPLTPEQINILNYYNDYFERRSEVAPIPPNDKIPEPGVGCSGMVWRVSDNGREIFPNEGEKSSRYVECLCFLIANYLTPWGYVLNGECDHMQDGCGYSGNIVVKDNSVVHIEYELDGNYEIIGQHPKAVYKPNYTRADYLNMTRSRWDLELDDLDELAAKA